MQFFKRAKAQRDPAQLQTTAPLIPRISYDLVPEDGQNIFRRTFAHLSETDWCAVLERSVDENRIDGVTFPLFPENELQQRIHGHFGKDSVREAAGFYKFTKSHTYGAGGPSDFNVLDFGCGWGRIIRLFMRDFELTNLFGFEPNFLFCALARTLNPYVTFFSGHYRPTSTLPANFFGLVFGWSVFSHLSREAAQAWLEEVARVLVAGGHCVFTTWGDRFLERLQREAIQQKAGEEIHWYSALCISKAGSVEQRLEEYRRGDFVWWDSVDNKDYGEAFISELALQRIIDECQIPLRICVFDKVNLPQDAFVLQRI